MAPIETATPEQVAQCVGGLLTRIRQLEGENVRLREARAETERLDEQLATVRDLLEYRTGQYNTLSEELERQANIIARLKSLHRRRRADAARYREALESIVDCLDPAKSPWMWEAAAAAASEDARAALEATE